MMSTPGGPPGPLPPGANDNRGPEIVAIVIAFPVLAAITVALRFYTRLRILKNASSDDLCIALALVLTIAVSVCTCYEVKFGMGRHVYMLTLDDSVGQMKALFASILTYNFGLFFTKLSIILQYLRICVAKPVRMACWAALGLIVAYCIETFFAGLFTCVPIAFFWDQTIEGGRCLDRWPLYFANAGINIFSDFLILILPIFMLRNLQLPRKQKFAIMVILALGGFACIASIVRLRVLYNLSLSQDPTWDNPGTATWSCIELNVGIICACASTLRPLFSIFMPSVFGSRRSDATPGYNFSGSRRSGQRSGGKFNTIEDGDRIKLQTDIVLTSSKASEYSKDEGYNRYAPRIS